MVWNDVRSDGQVLYAAEVNAIVTEISNIRSRIITLQAQSAIQPVTTPATLGIAETTTNKINYIYGEFPESVVILQWNVDMPTDWDGGNITPTFCWTTTVAGSTGKTCKWVLTARRFINDLAMDTALAAGTDATDTVLAVEDYHEIDGAAFTPTGTGNHIVFKLVRDYANDNLNGIARLISVKIKYNVT